MGGEGHGEGEMVCGEHKAVFLYIQGHQQDRARLLSGMHAGRTRKNCVKFKQEFQIGCLLQAFSPHEDSQAVAQVSQRGCADTVLGDFATRLSWSGLTADPAVSSRLD